MNTEYCDWKQVNVGFYGCPDYVYQTSCGQEYDVDKQEKGNFCLHCGKKTI